MPKFRGTPKISVQGSVIGLDENNDTFRGGAGQMVRESLALKPRSFL